ncbi:MAG: hypothetical protein ACI9E4_000851 [Pseudohongiellaceae bacterium]|jgi:hypothetical protein
MTKSKNLGFWTAEEKWINYYENLTTTALASICATFVAMFPMRSFRYAFYRLALIEADFGVTCIPCRLVGR